jgi:hypothetical protein
MLGQSPPEPECHEHSERNDDDDHDGRLQVTDEIIAVDLKLRIDAVASFGLGVLNIDFVRV